MPQIQDPRSLAYTPGATVDESGIPQWLQPISNWWDEQQRKFREWQQQQAMQQSQVNPMSGQMRPQEPTPMPMVQPTPPVQSMTDTGYWGQVPGNIMQTAGRDLTGEPTPMQFMRSLPGFIGQPVSPQDIAAEIGDTSKTAPGMEWLNPAAQVAGGFTKNVIYPLVNLATQPMDLATKAGEQLIAKPAWSAITQAQQYASMQEQNPYNTPPVPELVSDKGMANYEQNTPEGIRLAGEIIANPTSWLMPDNPPVKAAGKRIAEATEAAGGLSGQRGAIKLPEGNIKPPTSTTLRAIPKTVPDFKNKMVNSKWSIISAENPGWQIQAPEVNAVATQQLEADLRTAGYDPIRVSWAGGPGEPPENSLLVFGMEPAELSTYVEKYKQASGLTDHGYVFQDGSFGIIDPRKIDFSGKQTEYYSTVKIGGKDIKFTTEPPPERGGGGIPSTTMPGGRQTQITHYSPQEGLNALDQNFMGSRGPNTGAELKLKQTLEKTPGLFEQTWDAYHADGTPEPNIKSLGHQYTGEIPDSKLLNIDSPEFDKLYQQAAKNVAKISKDNPYTRYQVRGPDGKIDMNNPSNRELVMNETYKLAKKDYIAIDFGKKEGIRGMVPHPVTEVRGGKPRPTADPFETQPTRTQHNVMPEQPGRYTRPPMGRPPWEEGPVTPAAPTPAPEPPVGATTLPQQNAPLEAPQRPLTPPGGGTVPPTPETANLEPGMAQSTHAKKMNDTYNNMLYPDGNIPEYEKQNNAQLLARITAQDAADPEKSLRIIRGQEPASIPERRAFAIVAEERMINSGDIANLTEVLNKTSLEATQMGQANALFRGRYGATSPQTAVDAVIASRVEDAARQLPNTPIGDRLGGASNSPATRVTNEIRRQVGELRLSISQARRMDLQQANALLSSWTCR